MLSVLAAFANLIPIFGIYLGALPGVVVLLFVDPVQAAVFLALIIGLQQFDIRWLAPKVLGHTSGLSAFWVLFAIGRGRLAVGPGRDGAGGPRLRHRLRRAAPRGVLAARPPRRDRSRPGPRPPHPHKKCPPPRPKKK